MLGRHSVKAAILAASIGLPYLAVPGKKDAPADALSQVTPLAQHPVTAPPPTHGSTSAGNHYAGQSTGNHSVSAHSVAMHHAAGTTPAEHISVEGMATQDLAEVFRFDVSPAWVMSRWPRVSGSLAELDLQGYRVPLVTGTHDSDLAGSLTYYFDHQKHVERIQFHGTTGDPRRLVALMTGKFSLKPQRTGEPDLHLYQALWSGKPQSELSVRTARIIRAASSRSRYEVDLALKRPK